jgi:alpha-methylacyl-CoA racemase
VLSRDEASRHPHLAARATFIEHEGRAWGAPAPRFSRTPGALNRPLASPEFTETTLAATGFTEDEIRSLQADRIIG